MGSIKIKSELKSKLEQRAILTMALREALSILEMPLPTLAEWLQEQIEQNPALQFEEETPHHTSWSGDIAAPAPTLHTTYSSRRVKPSPPPQTCSRWKSSSETSTKKDF